MTAAHIHTFVAFANPFLACGQCKERVVSCHDPQQCGCRVFGWQNQPCGHQAATMSVCPSWGPVDGCRCLERFGSVSHGPAER